MNIAQNLKNLMVQHQLSSSKLARELHVHTSTISNWLDGKDVRVENLSALCDYFGCSLDYLVGNDAEKKPIPEDEHHQELNDEQLKVAYFRGADPSLTKEDLDAMWEDAKNFRDFILEKKRREKHGE